MSSNTPAIRPHVEIVNGQLVTNSFKIAEHFGKIHRDVVRAIDDLDCSPEFRVRNFAQSSADVPMPRGGVRQIKAYSITRDGFTFLAMGFTGSKAAQWKEAYIEAFNRMEAALRGPTNPLATLTTGRLLIRFDGNGGYTSKPVPNDAYVLSLDEIVRAVACPNDLPFSTAQLAAVIQGASQRLGRILDCRVRAQ